MNQARAINEPSRDCSLDRWIDGLPFFDTHSHAAGFETGTPRDDRQDRSLAQVLLNDYLAYLAPACWDQPLGELLANAEAANPAELYRRIEPLLDQYRALSTYAALREGIRELFGFDEPDIGRDNFAAINDKVLQTYRQHGQRAWHREVCQRAGIVRQNQMCYLSYVVDHYDELSPAECQAQQALLAPSLILDGFMFSGFAGNQQALRRAMQIVDIEPTTHRQHLELCARSLDLFQQRGGWSVKLLVAYQRPLRFQEVADTEAELLYQKGPDRLKPDELHRLQDNLAWHLVEMANQRGLPLIVHCGYMWPTHYADAEQLMPMMRSPRLPGLKLDVCHSNWPNEAGAMIMARHFPGVYFNLCWTPLLSEELGRRILSEAIDLLPRSKVLLGTDCGTSECMFGATRQIRRLLADVLNRKVQQGHFDMSVAQQWAKAVLHDNAWAFYGRSVPVHP